MKICFALHQFLPNFYAGTETLTYELAKGMRRAGHEVSIITGEPVDLETALKETHYLDEYDGFPILRINHCFQKAENFFHYEYDNVDSTRAIEEFLLASKPDILHITNCSRLSANIFEVTTKLHIPVVFTATDFWTICPLSQLRRYDQSMCTGPNFLRNNCIQCYFSHKLPQNKFGSDIYSACLALSVHLGILQLFKKDISVKWLDAMLCRQQYVLHRVNQANRIVAPTALMERLLIKNGVNPAKVIRNSFGINSSYEKSVAKKTAEEMRFAFIGNLAVHKGAHLAIEAFNTLKEQHSDRKMTLKIYGSGEPEYCERLEKLAEKNAQIKFMGTFPNELIGKVFSEIDVLLVPSIWYENTPLVIYSAFASKTPVIATNLGGMSEVVQDGINGFLFEKGQPSDLSRKMELILDEKIYQELRTSIPDTKTIEENVAEFEELYKKILQERRP